MPRRRLTEAEKQQRKANRSEKKSFLKQVFRDYDTEKLERAVKRKVKAFLSALYRTLLHDSRLYKSPISYM